MNKQPLSSARPPLRWLNYHHLYYFWVIAREGSMVRAASMLRLSQPTLSAQLRQLETSLNIELFHRKGKQLILTNEGRETLRYAEQIFSLGQELVDSIEGKHLPGRTLLRVGVVSTVSKFLVAQILSSVASDTNHHKLIVQEGRHAVLLDDLGRHALDVVISDENVPSEAPYRAFHHLLGEADIAMWGSPKLAKKYQTGFPGSLQDAPILLPTHGAVLRRTLDDWFSERQIVPRVVGEIEDSALMKALGEHGIALFALPDRVTDDVAKRFKLERVGPLEGAVEKIFLISLERRLKHPGVKQLASLSRELFGS